MITNAFPERRHERLSLQRFTVSVSIHLDEENMDWSPPTNYHMTHCKALDTPQCDVTRKQTLTKYGSHIC